LNDFQAEISWERLEAFQVPEELVNNFKFDQAYKEQCPTE